MKKLKIPALCFLLAFLLAETVWAGEAELLSVCSGECGATENDHITWTLDTATGALTVSGTGEMASYALEQYASRIKKATIQEGITFIGNYAFRNCVRMTDVAIPSSVIEIGERAFSGCSSLENVAISDGLSRIGEGAFSSCERLSRITLPNSVTDIAANAFAGCYNLNDVTIPNSVEVIDYGAFQSCYELSSITIPDSVTYLGNSAFYNCYELRSVTIGSGVSVIKESMFTSCENLESLVIPSNIKVIESLCNWDDNFNPNVYYAGDSAQWEAVKGDGKDYLAQYAASVHYNSTGPDAPGTTIPLTFTISYPSFGASIPLEITGGGQRTVNFFAAFYNENRRFIGANAVQETVFPGLRAVFVPVEQRFTPILKAFALDEDFKPLSPDARKNESGEDLPESCVSILSEADTQARNALIDNLTEQEAKDFMKRFTGWIYD